MTNTRLALSFLTVAALAACGGGSDPAPAAAPTTAGTPAATTPPAATPPASTPPAATPPAATPPAATPPAATPPAATPPAATPPAVSSVPSPTALPTAALAGTEADGQTVINEVNAGFASAKTGATGSRARTSYFKSSTTNQKETTLDITAATTTIDCASLGTGGSGSVTVNEADTLSTNRLNYSATFNKCNLGGGQGTLNGFLSYADIRYVSDQDYTYKVVFNNLTLTGVTGMADLEALTGSVTCEVKKDVENCYFSDGFRNWNKTDIAYDSTSNTANGTYATNYGDGSITVTYSNYTATSGTATVKASNGTYVLKRCSATAFTVTWTPTTGAVKTYKYGGGCA